MPANLSKDWGIFGPRRGIAAQRRLRDRRIKVRSTTRRVRNLVVDDRGDVIKSGLIGGAVRLDIETAGGDALILVGGVDDLGDAIATVAAGIDTIEDAVGYGLLALDIANMRKLGVGRANELVDVLRGIEPDSTFKPKPISLAIS